MGDASDWSYIDRFMRSPEGMRLLDQVRKQILGTRIESVEFTNECWIIGLQLHLEDGAPLHLIVPQWDITCLQESYFCPLDREGELDLEEGLKDTSP
jgi:hypothetical protein